jgi:hypothetical protein
VGIFSEMSNNVFLSNEGCFPQDVDNFGVDNLSDFVAVVVVEMSPFAIFYLVVFQERN